MREIIFRGKRIDNGKWVYGYYWHNIQDNRHLIIQSIPLGIMVSGQHQENAQVTPESIGQFTGLKDKNGVEIYEGDLLSDGDTIFEVEYNIQQSCFWISAKKNITNDGDDIMFYMNNGVLGNGHYSRNDLEIIGNIYEHPDLIK